MNLILCGLPRSGKTFYGKKIAEQLNRLFIDTDRWIEDRYQLDRTLFLPCREIYLKEGEQAFRTRERKVLECLEATSNAVVALGGGALIDDESRKNIKMKGCVVYLKKDLSTLWHGIQQEKKLPAFLEGNSPYRALCALAQQRIPHYEEVADEVIDIDGKEEKEVLALLSSYIN